MATTGSFVSRELRATFSSPAKPFSDGEKLVLSGLRMSVRVSSSSGFQSGFMSLAVWGLTQTHLNELFFNIRAPWSSPPESLRVLIEAREDNAAWVLVWNGTVADAHGDYEGMPEVALMVTGSTWFLPSMDAAAAHSFPGSVDVTTILQQIASDAKLTLINDGISNVTLTNMATKGTTAEQLDTVCSAVPGISYQLSDEGVAVWMTAKGLSAEAITIGPETGMIGYPIISLAGVMLRCRYRPGLRNGQSIKVVSALPKAKGTFVVGVFSHALDAQVPGGLWETEIVTIPTLGTLDG